MFAWWFGWDKRQRQPSCPNKCWQSNLACYLWFYHQWFEAHKCWNTLLNSGLWLLALLWSRHHRHPRLMTLDPHQNAFRTNRSTEDVISTSLLSVFTHLQNKNSYIQLSIQYNLKRDLKSGRLDSQDHLMMWSCKRDKTRNQQFLFADDALMLIWKLSKLSDTIMWFRVDCTFLKIRAPPSSFEATQKCAGCKCFSVIIPWLTAHLVDL